MNTLTRLSVEMTAQGRRIELFEGQTVVKATLREPELVELAAGNGLTRARQARFDVRHDEGDQVCITCLEGQVEVRNPHGRMQLAANEQVTYDKGRMGLSRSIDSAVVSAWQSGMLIFHNQPLSAVIAEVNRYRPGRIVIGSDALGRRVVEAVILLDQMQDVVRQVQQLSGARAVHLAGGIVVLM
jgi:transmembrane sensor